MLKYIALRLLHIINVYQLHQKEIFVWLFVHPQFLFSRSVLMIPLHFCVPPHVSFDVLRRSQVNAHRILLKYITFIFLHFIMPIYCASERVSSSSHRNWFDAWTDVITKSINNIVLLGNFQNIYAFIGDRFSLFHHLRKESIMLQIPFCCAWSLETSSQSPIKMLIFMQPFFFCFLNCSMRRTKLNRQMTKHVKAVSFCWVDVFKSTINFHKKR